MAEVTYPPLYATETHVYNPQNWGRETESITLEESDLRYIRKVGSDVVQSSLLFTSPLLLASSATLSLRGGRLSVQDGAGNEAFFRRLDRD